MLQNAYLLAKVGADTAENEQHVAEILPIGRRVADARWLLHRGDRAVRVESHQEPASTSLRRLGSRGALFDFVF